MERRQFRAPRGIRDVLPHEIQVWRVLEDAARELAELRGYREIRPALLEEVDLFTRSVGEVTDIVQKEMFTLQKGDGTLALRPEATAGIVRAYLEAGYASSAPLQRLFTIGPMFRYERPQRGRERMFTQFDVEALGSLDPRLDAEVIHLAASFFDRLGFKLEQGQLEVRVNSMGDGEDRDRWREAVRAFLAPTIAEHCELCRARFERNVLRVLDCKNPRCKELNAGAPAMLEYLSRENRAHFDDVQTLLVALGLKVVVDSSIVRGLDYYTRTVFEVHAPLLGARSAVCGGGRYDHLIRDLGGPDLGAVGFAVGFTSTMLHYQGVFPELLNIPPLDVFVVSAGEGLDREVFLLAQELRTAGISAVFDVEERSLKAQMKLAGKGHRFAVILGPDEINSGKLQLKDLGTGEQHELARAALPAELRARLAARGR